MSSLKSAGSEILPEIHDMENPLHNMYRTTNWDLIPNPFHPGVLLLLWELGCRKLDPECGCGMQEEGYGIQEVGCRMHRYRTADVG